MKIKLFMSLILCGFLVSNVAAAAPEKAVAKMASVKKTIPLTLGGKKSGSEPKKICCTPVTPNSMADALSFKHDSGGLGANYTLKFTPNSIFKNQMQAYINYVHYMSGNVVNSVIINWQLRECGTGVNPSNSCSGIIGGNHFTEWCFGGNGNLCNGGGGFWPNSIMEVNKWYQVHTGTYLDKLSDRYINKKKCANNKFYVRISLQKSAKGGGKLQISDGKRIIKTIPLK